MVVLFFYCSQEVQAENKNITIPGVVTAVVATMSLTQGIFNIRHYVHIINQCRTDYHLDSYHVDWNLYLAQWLQDVICSYNQSVDFYYANTHKDCMKETAEKILLFDAENPNIIWQFNQFKDFFPHTTIQSKYCVSKKYLTNFGYTDLAVFKHALALHIEKLEKDFKNLLSLTSFVWSQVKMPRTFIEFENFKSMLAENSDHYGLYGFLGMFGYSCIHNGKSIQNTIIDIIKLHAFFINLQELLKTCIDADTTSLIDPQGVLYFSLQHVNFVKKEF
ncbi:MAG: hypothetical protein ACXWL2_01930 [Candidatus Chromulinivorax sp.]